MIARPGSALVLATMIATLVAAAAIAMVSVSDRVRAESADTFKLVRSRLAAVSLLEEGVIFLDEAASNGVVVNKTCRQFPSGSLCWESVAGLVDLNTGSEDALARLFQALGAEQEQAKHSARAFVEERSLRARLQRGAAFTYEGEVLQLRLPGIDDKILPLVTVYSGRANPLRAAAPGQLRPFLDNDGIDPFAGAGFGQVYLMAASVPLSKAASLRVRRWVRPTGNPQDPILIHRQDEDIVRAGAVGA